MNSSAPLKILVVAAHPDDEVLGCGGTMAMHARQGHQVHSLILAEGITSRTVVRRRKQVSAKLSRLASAARQATHVLGAKSIDLHDFPDNRMDSVNLLDVVKVVEAAVAKLRPDVVYTHHAGDLNVDHRLTHQAVVTACRPMVGHSVKTILCFEVPSSTDWQTAQSAVPFVPNWFTNIEHTLALKIKALEAYNSEMRPWPHPRSYRAIEHLAHWRGATAGVDAAEAFMLARHIAGEQIAVPASTTIQLRPLTETDLDRVLSWRNSSRVRPVMFNDALITETQHHAWFSRLAWDKTMVVRMVELDGLPIGVVNFKELDRRAKGCVWGFYVGNPDAPKGSGFRMATAALDYAFTTLKVDKVRGEVFEFNTKSLELHRRLGFKELGLRAQPHIKAGVPVNVVLFTLNRSTWQAYKKAHP